MLQIAEKGTIDHLILEFPVYFDLLLAGFRVLLTNLDFLDQHHHKLPREGLQLQQLPRLSHDLFLIARLLLVGELLINLGQPKLQAAFFGQKS